MKVFVITYITIVVLAAFSNAQMTNPDLPTFQYRLTEKPEAERQQLCDLNKGFCQTNCGGPDKAPMNFCNSTTMGWGCGCIDKVPDLLGYEWPINREHCIGSGEACKGACAEPTVPNENKPKCNQACIETYTQKCGTPDQPPAYYNVPDITTVPTYAPPENAKSPTGDAPADQGKAGSTNGGGSNNSTSEKSIASSLNLGSAAITLIIVASGISALNSL